MESKPTKYRVTENYESPYPDPLVFQEGDVVEVGETFTGDPDWQNWIWCKGKSNSQAWVPKQYLDLDEGTGTFRKDYDALELSVCEGEELEIYEVVNGFGMAERADGQRGWVPMRNLTPIS